MKFFEGVRFIFSGLLLSSCSVSNVSNAQSVTKVEYEICVQSKTENACQTITSKNLYWGEVEDVKLVPFSNNLVYKGFVVVKSKGCVGWYDEPQELDYYWDQSGILHETPVDINNVTVKLVKTETIPNNQQKKMVQEATIKARDAQWETFNPTNCDTEAQVVERLDKPFLKKN